MLTYNILFYFPRKISSIYEFKINNAEMKYSQVRLWRLDCLSYLLVVASDSQLLLQVSRDRMYNSSLCVCKQKLQAIEMEHHQHQ